MDEDRIEEQGTQPRVDPDELQSLRDELAQLRGELEASREELSKTRQLNFTLARRLDVGSEKKQTIEQQIFDLFGRKRGGDRGER